MGTMQHLLSIDLGTSSVKVLLVTEEGQVIGRGMAEYPILRPGPDRAEQDPEAWWQATATAVRQALAGAGSGRSIAAIGLSGQMHGTVLLGEQGLLRPAIIWPDQRSRRQVQEITRLVGPERLIEIGGSPVATGFQAATVRWLQQEEPDLWRRVRSILLPKDYLRWRLSGVLATEPSDASSTLLLDVRRRDWSHELLERLEIDLGLLPPVESSLAVTGELGAESAEALGLAPGIPIVGGAGDTPAGQLGAGIVGSDTLLLTISTGGQVVLPIEEVRVDLRARIHTFCAALPPAPDRAGWYQMAATLAAGLALRWLRDEVFDLRDEDAYERMTAWAETSPPGADGLLFLPYLVGERTPHMNPQARGLFLGLSAHHGRAALVRAVMEGVTLACYDAFSVLLELGAAPREIVLAGGGARSGLWRQIVADVFGLPVRPLAVGEQSAFGAALLAGGGIGLFDPAEAALAWAAYGEPVEPDPRHHARYRELLALFRAAYRKHRDDFPRLQALP